MDGKVLGLFGSTQLVRENRIDGFISCQELSGACRITVEIPMEKRECHILIVADKGEMTLSTDEEKKVFRGPCALNVASATPIREVRCSKSFHAFVTGIDFDLLLDIFRNRNPFPGHIRSRFRLSEGFHDIEPDKMKNLLADCRQLMDSLGKKSHRFIEELNYAKLYILLTDFADIVWDKEESGSPDHRQKLSRGDTLLLNFMGELSANIERETSVQFYADRLFISKQYLAALVRKKAGIGVGKVIETFRFETAMKYIHDPSYSIKQIADKMSFPDQSAFGKFFRKHSGSSPGAYRKNLKNSLLSGRGSSAKTI